ncbi:MAG: Crp/Fnr family transcriptional regulator [Pseudomonadota bacterium]
MADSCFVTKLKHYLDLTAAEQKALSVLEEGEYSVAAGEVVFAEESGDADALYVVRDGLLHSSRLMKDGGRQILRIFHPGDVMGTASIAFAKPSSTAVAAVDSSICRFPKTSLMSIYTDYPRLAALFYSLGMLENVVLCDRLRSIGRSDGEARIALLLLDFRDRLKITRPGTAEAFDLPLTQADISDAIGMTPIHTNRLFMRMRTEGLIEWTKGHVRLLDEKRLADLSDYVNRYESLDKSWYPQPTTGSQQDGV